MQSCVTNKKIKLAFVKIKCKIIPGEKNYKKWTFFFSFVRGQKINLWLFGLFKKVWFYHHSCFSIDWLICRIQVIFEVHLKKKKKIVKTITKKLQLGFFREITLLHFKTKVLVIWRLLRENNCQMRKWITCLQFDVIFC